VELSKTRVGMVTFVVSEATFFLMLVIAYVYYQGHPASSGQAARLLDPWRTGGFSLCLFASSYTVRRAGIALRRSRASRLHLWLGATILLGAIFLVGQVREYLGLFRAGQSLGRDLASTSGWARPSSWERSSWSGRCASTWASSVPARAWGGISSAAASSP